MYAYIETLKAPSTVSESIDYILRNTVFMTQLYYRKMGIFSLVQIFAKCWFFALEENFTIIVKNSRRTNHQSTYISFYFRSQLLFL